MTRTASGSTVVLKDGRTVKILEHVNIGEGWIVQDAAAKTPKEHIPFLVQSEDFAMKTRGTEK